MVTLRREFVQSQFGTVTVLGGTGQFWLVTHRKGRVRRRRYLIQVWEDMWAVKPKYMLQRKPVLALLFPKLIFFHPPV